MLRKSKWIDNVAADSPLTEAARAALEERLPLVSHYLPLSAEKHEEEVEYVHQLRVATRRSAATVEIFQDTLPRKRRKWFERCLKRVRRAAGEARDMDVLCERFSKDDETARQYAALLEEIAQRRQTAQAPIVEVYHRVRDSEYDRRVAGLLKRIRWRGEGSRPSLAKAAPSILRPIASKFMESGRADLADIHNLHTLRKDGKQLRYAMELLANAFDDSFRRKLYPKVEGVQERLGEINDHFTAHERFSRWAQHHRGTELGGMLADLAADEEAAMLATGDAFRDWWSSDRKKRLYSDLDSTFGP